MLKSRLLVGLSSLGLISIATSATAQLGAREVLQDEKAKEAASEPAIIELSRLRNASVCIGELSGGGTDLIPGATVGKLEDMVLDRERLELTHAVVRTDAGLRTVLASRMTWSEGQKKWVLALTATQFSEAPVFDLAKLGEAASGAIDAKGKRGGDIEPASSPRHLLLSGLSKSPVKATDGVLGELGQIVMYADGPEIAFITVKPEKAKAGREDAGTLPSMVAIPWGLCGVETIEDAGTPPLNGGGGAQGGKARAGSQGQGEEMKTEVLVRSTQEKIVAAPAAKDSDGHRLSDHGFRAKIYQHFGLKPPSYDQKPAGSPR